MPGRGTVGRRPGRRRRDDEDTRLFERQPVEEHFQVAERLGERVQDVAVDDIAGQSPDEELPVVGRFVERRRESCQVYEDCTLNLRLPHGILDQFDRAELPRQPLHLVEMSVAGVRNSHPADPIGRRHKCTPERNIVQHINMVEGRVDTDEARPAHVEALSPPQRRTSVDVGWLDRFKEECYAERHGSLLPALLRKNLTENPYSCTCIAGGRAVK